MIAAARILSVAKALYEQEPDWVIYFREIFGVNGAIRQTFKSTDDIAAFQNTTEFSEIQEMLNDLRNRSNQPHEKKTIKVVTVRMPKELHSHLTEQSKRQNTSINKLIISKLLADDYSNY